MGILYKWVHYDRERGPVDRDRNCTIMEERSAVLFVYLYNWKYMDRDRNCTIMEERSAVLFVYLYNWKYFKNMKCETSQPMYM